MPTLNPFCAVQYSEKNQKNLGGLSVADLDSAENLWGTGDSSLSFRNLLVGPPEHRSQVWQAWLSSGELQLVDELSFYVLSQEFLGLAGKKCTRFAVYGSADVTAGKILTHENVFPEGVERARQATEACEGDIAPIFASLDTDNGGALRALLQKICEKENKLARYIDAVGMEVSLWRVSTKKSVKEIQDLIGEKELYLLDGHHRLAAALANLKAGLGDGKILVCLSSMEPEDISIYPIHRLIYCERWMLPGAMLEDLIQRGCSIKPITDAYPRDIESVLADVEKMKHPAAVILHAHDDRLQLLTFGKNTSLPQLIEDLPVARLDFEVLKDLNCSIIPSPDLRLAMEQLAMDQAQVAFFLPAVKASQVQKAAAAKITLPRKSTRFVPKPPIGLVCRPWSI